VTEADELAERILSAALRRIDPAARIVGEEGCARGEAAYAFDGGPCWIIDPLDGTRNFVEGKSAFGIIIAFAIDGIVEAGWLYAPLTGRLCHAVRGGGAYVDGMRVQSRREVRRPVACLATQFMTAAQRSRVTEAFAGRFALEPIPMCAAEHYPRLALSRYDAAVFQRTLAWDHGAGALFLEEAGGRVSRWNGEPYRLQAGGGIVAASDPATWELAMEALALSELTESAMLSPETRADVQAFEYCGDDNQLPPNALEASAAFGF
jgi:fructose-1,6-bisphosphatase/inositol monophosphatase family enzyme